jgi:hypothetical protein
MLPILNKNITAYLSNLSRPPPQDGHLGIWPRTFPSAHFSTS